MTENALSSQIKAAAEKAKTSHEAWLKCPDENDIQKHCTFLADDLLLKEACTFNAIRLPQEPSL